MAKYGTLLAALLIAALAAFTAATTYWSWYLSQPGPLAQTVTLNIPEGAHTADIASTLVKGGVVANPLAFRLAVRLMHLDKSLQAGEYLFDPHIPLHAVVDKIAQGQAVPHLLTVPEGTTVKQVVALLEASAELSGTILRRPAEGMVFPDTYKFHLGSGRQTLLDHMHRRMTDELTAAWAGRDTSLPLATPDDLLTLASLVQKEAANDAEMPHIASVFVNRLNRHMKLQSDPTVIYGAESYQGDIHKKDLTDPNPFNTYVNPGLPPTPIANPGKAALLAAAHPLASGDLFFVADPSRTAHIFTPTYAAHEKAVKQYWKAHQTPKAKPAPKSRAKAAPAQPEAAKPKAVSPKP
jgi:UPF0755 protein